MANSEPSSRPCRVCGAALSQTPLERKRRGYLCLDCHHAEVMVRQNRARSKPENRSKLIAYWREYNQRRQPSDTTRAKSRRGYRHRKENHPHKLSALRAVRTAIEMGALIPPSACEMCHRVPKPRRNGARGINAHHDDYGKPLEVRWLCGACHTAVHR